MLTKNPSMVILMVVAGGLFLATGLNCPHLPSELDLELQSILAMEGIEPIAKPAIDTDKVVLGQALFFDKILSGNENISCATCHHPTLNTGDHLSLAVGEGGSGLGPLRTIPTDENDALVFIPRNSPPLFNRGELKSMFWDGRVEETADGDFDSPAGEALLDGLESALAAQAMFPVTSREEMRGQPGSNDLADLADDDFQGMWQALMSRVLAIEEYQNLFAAAFPEVSEADLTFAHAANAIAAFEINNQTLDDSPFDEYLRGDLGALSDAAKRGAILFYTDAGCVRCHSGSLMTDESFHNVGVPPVGPGKGDGEDGRSDFGRERVTGEPRDRYRFRTPSLRNVAATGPWFHSGAITTLEGAVRHMLDPTTSAESYDVTQLRVELQPTAGLDELPDILSDLDSRVASGVTLSDGQVEQLVAFLNTLTAESIADLVENDLPESVPSGLPVED